MSQKRKERIDRMREAFLAGAYTDALFNDFLQDDPELTLAKFREEKKIAAKQAIDIMASREANVANMLGLLNRAIADLERMRPGYNRVSSIAKLLPILKQVLESKTFEVSSDKVTPEFMQELTKNRRYLAFVQLYNRTPTPQERKDLNLDARERDFEN